MKTVMVVDDNLPMLQIVISQLRGAYSVVPARSGGQALSICAVRRPDLILLDAEMPDLDGWETIGLLKKNDGLSSIPVVFVSGLDGEDVEGRALAAGAVGFIRKPFDRDFLLKKLAEHLSG